MLRVAAECEELPSDIIPKVNKAAEVSGKHLRRVWADVIFFLLQTSLISAQQRYEQFLTLATQRTVLKSIVSNSKSSSVRHTRPAAILRIWRLISSQILPPRLNRTLQRQLNQVPLPNKTLSQHSLPTPLSREHFQVISSAIQLMRYPGPHLALTRVNRLNAEVKARFQTLAARGCLWTPTPQTITCLGPWQLESWHWRLETESLKRFRR